MKVYYQTIHKHHKSLNNVNDQNACYLPLEIIHFKIKKSLWDKVDSKYKKEKKIKKGEVLTQSLVLGQVHPVSFSFEYIEKHSVYGGEHTTHSKSWYIEIDREDLQRLDDSSIHWLRSLLSVSQDIHLDCPDDVLLSQWLDATLPLLTFIPSLQDIIKT